SMVDPPRQQRKQCARMRKRNSRNVWRWVFLHFHHALLDASRKNSLSKFKYVVNFSRRYQACIEILRLGEMFEQFAHRRHAHRLLPAPRENSARLFEEVLDIAQEQIVLVAIVRIKSRPADFRTVQHILHRDLVERLFDHQLDQRIAEHVAPPGNSDIEFSARYSYVSGHRIPLCSTTPRL